MPKDRTQTTGRKREQTAERDRHEVGDRAAAGLASERATDRKPDATRDAVSRRSTGRREADRRY